MKELNILGNILSPFNGIAIMGITAVWATTKFHQDSFRCWLLIFAGLCIICASVGDYLHHYFKNLFEQRGENKTSSNTERTQTGTA